MIAYTEKLGFDVLTTPIAEIDRRTLSQAWFSALHLGSASRSAVVPLQQSRDDNHVPGRPESGVPPGIKQGTPSMMRPIGRENVAFAGNIYENVSVDRRGPVSVLARKIERALLDRRTHYGTFVLDGMQGRVHLSVCSKYGRIHIVAMCSPQAKAYVACALQHVRFALARKNIAFKGEVR